jgi:hypothetical protein
VPERGVARGDIAKLREPLGNERMIDHLDTHGGEPTDS